MPDHELDDEEWIEDENDDGEDEFVCPSCRAEVHEETQQCPHCGDWITPVERGHWSKKILFLIAVALMLLMMLIFFVL